MTNNSTPVTLIEPENQGAKRPRARTPKPIYQHQDKLNQPLNPGQPVVFSFGYSNDIRLGTVVKSTSKRVRIAYVHTWRDRNDQPHSYEWNYLADPKRILALTDSLPNELLMLKLKGLIP